MSSLVYSMYSMVLFIVMMMLMVEALPVEQKVPAACLGFRLTSPVKTGLTWTYGQCYSADWDVGASQVTTITTVQLIDAKSKKVITTEAKNIPASKGTSGNFPLLMGDDVNPGNYYFQINAKTSSSKTCSVTSATFNVIVNPNSPPSTHCD
ncbi:uncharacterized protein BX664DRAFT_321814 [Halteromyces radiatus]|uniref:uncharacterized protein n=1 Tax=Halteromyces radiatus TaxID=101107 RepID=UPI00221F99CC|nr:uncharacterized protein BX664DRAFT_321814 [Halteromyces radiatus]KAI8099658.1 hypothetical protein BX664DRAFT_321814 [Halteromyces radiatus]